MIRIRFNPPGFNDALARKTSYVRLRDELECRSGCRLGPWVPLGSEPKKGARPRRRRGRNEKLWRESAENGGETMHHNYASIGFVTFLFGIFCASSQNGEGENEE